MRLIRVVAAVFVWQLIAWGGTATATDSDRPRHVLLLYAESRLLPGIIDADAAFRSTLSSDSGAPVVFHTEFLDLPPSPGAEYEQRLRDLLYLVVSRNDLAQQEETSMKDRAVRTLSCVAVLVMVTALTLSAAAPAAELGGVTLADTLKAGEKTLKLNGLGLRRKAMFKVYVGGLYLESPSKDAGAILSSDQGKAIRLHFLRDLTKAQRVEAFKEGFEANAKDKAAEKAAFDRMLALVPDVKEGASLTFTYLPGQGTTLQVADKELGAFRGKGFADAVFSIWLGSKPPSEELRKGMLG